MVAQRFSVQAPEHGFKPHKAESQNNIILSTLQPVIEDIEAILGTTVENADEDSEDGMTEPESWLYSIALQHVASYPVSYYSIVYPT